MVKISMTESYIVRIYRYDTKDNGEVVGMVEAIDGSGDSRSFRDIDELIEALKSLLKRHKKSKKEDRHG